MREKIYESAFNAIADTPGEALNMKLRASLMRSIIDITETRGWSQSEAASEFGVTEPRMSELQHGKLSRFSLDDLVNMLSRLGDQCEVTISVSLK
ncbi:MAG: XRE family transcriptional regulator [Candidatus Thiodiazotropha sp. (ex Lucina pensylvanica)]|nr:XRE family transcriptional regulator [Candidatus Thiodiazotropha sp. (ex Lucina pensylvanica)]